MIELAWHDTAVFTPEDPDGYTKPLKVENWDRALWEFSMAANYPDLPSQLKDLQAPTLVITGDDDQIVPTQQSIRLAGEISGAKLVVIPNCGHMPQEERPEEFMQAIKEFVNFLGLF